MHSPSPACGPSRASRPMADGSRLTKLDPGWQIWLFDVQRRALTQVSRSDGVSFNAVWMPDSKSIIHSVETPVYDLQRLPIDGTAAETLRVSRFDKFVSAVSPDSRTIAFTESGTGADKLLLAPITGGAPTVVDARPATQRSADFSADGRWLAYDEVGANGNSEVYVRAIDGHGGRHQVSNDGGDQARWTRRGQEIVYRKGDAVFAASFDAAKGEAGVPSVLFRKHDLRRAGQTRTRGYDVSPDGSRFLILTPVLQPGAVQTRVVINWAEELAKKVPR